MDEIKKIAGINLLILLIYTIILPLLPSSPRERGYVILFVGCVLIGIQVGVNLVAAIVLFILGKKGLALSFLATAPLILLVGFSTCFGSVALLG